MAQTATQLKKLKRERRHRRIRSEVSGTALRPRLAVFRSNKYMYAQLIDDDSAKTLVSASNMKSVGNKSSGAEAVGSAIAVGAKAKNISKVVFDRAGYIFTGRVKAVAEAARKGGLEF